MIAVFVLAAICEELVQAGIETAKKKKKKKKQKFKKFLFL